MLSKRDEIRLMVEAEDLVKVLDNILFDIRQSEKDIIDNLKKNAEEMLSTYKSRIHAFAKLLRKLSINAFVNTDINHVRVYDSEDAVPDDYRQYKNYAENLVDMVIVDILTQKSTELKLLALERWISLSRICLEQGDIFTAGNLITGIAGNYLITKSKLMDHVSAENKSFIDENSLNFTRQQKIIMLHKDNHEDDKTCIPMLTCLSNVLENTKVVDEGKTHEEKELSRSNSRSLYTEMQSRAHAFSRRLSMTETVNYAYNTLIMNTDSANRKRLHSKYEKHASKTAKKIPAATLIDILSRAKLEVPVAKITKRSPVLFQNSSPRMDGKADVSLISTQPLKSPKKE